MEWLFLKFEPRPLRSQNRRPIWLPARAGAQRLCPALNLRFSAGQIRSARREGTKWAFCFETLKVLVFCTAFFVMGFLGEVSQLSF